MTLPAIPGQGDLSVWSGSETGLEDFDASDASIPRLRIEHIDGAFRDTQTDRKYPELRVKMLGLVKQRLMWRGEPKEGNEVVPPLCKSNDFRLGFPNMDPKAAADDKFPWEASNYTPSDLSAVPGTNLLGLSCDGCAFKEWGSNPKSATPWCSETWVIPLLYWDGTDWTPAIFSIKRSGLKAARRYFTSFSAKRQPLFTMETKMTLDKQRRGMVQYCTPIFEALGQSDPNTWDDHAADFRDMRAYLSTHPQDRSEEAGPIVPDRVTGNENVIVEPAQSQPTPPPVVNNPPPVVDTAPAPAPAPSSQPAPPPSTPAPAPTPAVSQEIPALADDDEPPF